MASQTINTLTIRLPEGLKVNLEFFPPVTSGAPQADANVQMSVAVTPSTTGSGYVATLNPKGHGGPHPMKDAIC